MRDSLNNLPQRARSLALSVTAFIAARLTVLICALARGDWNCVTPHIKVSMHPTQTDRTGCTLTVCIANVSPLPTVLHGNELPWRIEGPCCEISLAEDSPD